MIALRPVAALAAIGLLAAAGMAAAQNTTSKHEPGVTDTSIKIGNIMPYSGPASAYGVIGTAEAAYFRKINDEGGINGRKIDFISYDDSYSPPKTVEQARKLVEDDGVLLIFNSLGTPTNTAIEKYLNGEKVPQLFVATGATKWNDPKEFPRPWAGSQATRLKRTFTQNTFWRTSPMRRSQSSTRTMIMARIISRVWRMGLAAGPT